MSSAFEPPDLDFTIFTNGEEAIRDWNILILLRWKEDNVSVDRLYCQRETSLFLDVSGESFKIFVPGPFLPDIERVHECVKQLISTALGNFLRNPACFPGHSVDGFVRFNLSEASI